MQENGVPPAPEVAFHPGGEAVRPSIEDTLRHTASPGPVPNLGVINTEKAVDNGENRKRRITHKAAVEVAGQLRQLHRL